jgi:hypothetical protein
MATDGNINLGDLSGKVTPFLLAGSLESALPLPPFALDATGETGQAFEGFAPALQLAAFSGDGGMADGMVLRAPRLQALAVAGASINAILALPAFGAAGSLDGPLALPPLALSASGAAGATAQGALALSAFQLAAQAIDHAALALPPFDLAGAMLAGQLARGQSQLAGWILDAEAWRDTLASGQAQLPLLQLQAVGRADSAIDAVITLSAPELAAAAVSGSVATASLTVPLYASAADGEGGPGAIAEIIGSATVLLPAFGASAVTVHLARPAAAAVLLNTRIKGVTRYEGLAANSFATFAGVQLAATPDGIVALMGETDLGFPITASITAGTSDFGAAERKRIEAGYVGYRAGGDMELTLITDEHHEYTYRLAARQMADAIHGNRVKFGRGVDGRYWQWKLANTGGGAFELASVQLDVVPLSRSV